jgi:phospholipid transport system substrate-binding protein
MSYAVSTCATVRHRPGYAGAFFLLFALLLGNHVSAQIAEDPAAARAGLERLAREMVTALQDPAVRKDVRRIRQLVVQTLVPQIDFRVSSNLVLGEHWAEASEAQQSAFIQEFQSFLVRFYTGALASYVDSGEVTVPVMSFNEEPRVKDERQLIVRSQVGQPSGDSVAVDYRMFWRDSWRIIDVSVRGISMVQNYRSNFISTVQQQGIDVLIAQLQKRNQSFSAN